MRDKKRKVLSNKKKNKPKGYSEILGGGGENAWATDDQKTRGDKKIALRNSKFPRF